MLDGDLEGMNQLIARHCGWQTPGSNDYLSYVPRCVALPPTVQQCQALLRSNVPTRIRQLSSAARINKQYLEFLRLNCRRVLLGEWDWLVILHANLAQARYFAELSNEQIGLLAANWEGAAFTAPTPVVEAEWTAPMMAQHAVTGTGWMGALTC